MESAGLNRSTPASTFKTRVLFGNLCNLKNSLDKPSHPGLRPDRPTQDALKRDRARPIYLINQSKGDRHY